MSGFFPILTTILVIAGVDSAPTQGGHDCRGVRRGFSDFPSGVIAASPSRYFDSVPRGAQGQSLCRQFPNTDAWPTVQSVKTGQITIEFQYVAPISAPSLFWPILLPDDVLAW